LGVVLVLHSHKRSSIRPCAFSRTGLGRGFVLKRLDSPRFRHLRTVFRLIHIARAGHRRERPPTSTRCPISGTRPAFSILSSGEFVVADVTLPETELKAGQFPGGERVNIRALSTSSSGFLSGARYSSIPLKNITTIFLTNANFAGKYTP
jgi:hypothetical protein